MKWMKGIKSRWLWGVVLAAGLCLPQGAAAQWRLVDGEEVSLELSANLQMLSAYVVLPQFELPPPLEGLFPEDAGLGSAVGRLEWSARFGERVSVEMHNRLFWQASTITGEELQQGFGVTRGVDRRLDSETVFLESETTRLVHDFDRLLVGIYFERADVYLGRQAISWGVSSLFPVADRFAPLSPFELDTLQRRGLDAARVVAHVTPEVEVDLVVADRGPDEPLAMAGRVEYFGAAMDVYAGVGRFWERLSALGGVSWLAGNWKVYGEGEALWNLEEGALDPPRVTVGAQRVSMSWQIGAELHYNGFGTTESQDYAAVLASPEFQRGESYFLGRYYGGVNGFYAFETGWGLGGGVMANLMDPSVVIFPSVQYEVGQQMTVSAGAFLGFGEGGQVVFEGLVPALVLESEYGSFADMYFVQMAAFF